MRHSIAVMLHNVRSVHNVGSIFRTAEASGASHIYLSGYTPSPRDRFGRVRKELAKTALGAENLVEWSQESDPLKLIAKLKKRGWHIVGVEQDPRARNYRTFKTKTSTVFVFGNEVRGLSMGLRKACDSLIEIPMHGQKESLNVSVAAGIILFNIRQ